MTYGEAMRAARERAGLSQMQLALEIGVSCVVISSAELGYNSPGLYFCADLAEYLGISIDEMLGFEHKPFSQPKTPRQYRKAAGLTQRELGKKAGVSVRTIGSVEALKHVPRIGTIVRIAHALGLGIDEYIGRMV